MENCQQIAGKLDALGLWNELAGINWAVKVKGRAMPFFCTVLKGCGNDAVKCRVLFLEGWQTLHDFIRLRMDESFGYYISPMEMLHYELVVFNDSTGARIFKHDSGYVPREVKSDSEQELCAKLLWQTYGVMLRLESDMSLAMKYAEERAFFSRVETESGEWCDAPLVICDPLPVTETVSFPVATVDKAKSLPLEASRSIYADFSFVPGVMTKDPKPRTVYRLSVKDLQSGELFTRDMSMPVGGTLKGMWERLPSDILSLLVERSFIPGEIKMKSKRLFRLMRPLMHQLPVKLSITDSAP